MLKIRRKINTVRNNISGLGSVIGIESGKIKVNRSLRLSSKISTVRYILFQIAEDTPNVIYALCIETGNIFQDESKTKSLQGLIKIINLYFRYMEQEGNEHKLLTFIKSNIDEDFLKLYKAMERILDDKKITLSKRNPKNQNTIKKISRMLG